MAQKWNLQDIRPAVKEKAPSRDMAQARAKIDIAPRQSRAERVEQTIDPDLSTIDVIDGNSAKRKRVIITALCAVLIVGAGFFVNVFLGGASVTVYPKMEDISVQADFTAYLEPKAGELGYELLTLESTGSKQVKASGKETVSLRAEGKIFIYNTVSTAPQRLIKNTRFETKDGLIFRIKESVEVPGATKDAKGNAVPGSVVADVFADGTGEQYNIPPSRFTVPGLKDTDQYESVYAESSAAFVGGFEGEKYIIDAGELDTAKQALHMELRAKMLEELKSKIPAGFTVYEGAVTFAFDSLPSTQSGDSLALIEERGRLQVPMFKSDDFARYVAGKTIPDYGGAPVNFLDPLTLTFSYQSPTTTVSDISGYKELPFTLTGGAKIIWDFDVEALQADLVGIDKNAVNEVFVKYPAISNAQAELRPFWVSKFPDSKEEIVVTTVLEKKE